MKFILTKRFASAYRALPDDLKRKIDKALRLLIENPKHPSLHLKKMRGAPGIWEMRIDKGCRLTLEIHPDAFLLRNVGKHDEALGSP